MMIKKPLNGQESSILSLIAQSNNSIKGKEAKEILKCLNGVALDIAKVMLTGKLNADEEINIAAKGFIEWANGLNKVNYK